MMHRTYTYRTIFFSFVSLVVMGVCLSACQKESLYEKKDKPEVVIAAGDERLQASVIHLSRDTVYVLAASINCQAGQKLEIEAGTVVKMRDKLSITIQAGASIDAAGTADAPIVFTSNIYTGGAGVGGGGSLEPHYWYGIRIYGNAGSGQPTSSGKLQYVRIEFAGGDENQLGWPSLLLKEVTSETVIDHIQVSYSFNTSSIEFSGGNCNASHLISYASNRSDFYFSNGYTGKLQYLLAYRHPYFPDVMSPDFAGLLIDGAGTFPVISNASVIGPDMQRGTSFYYQAPFERRVALLTLGGAKFHIANTVLMGFPRGAWYLAGNTTAIPYANGESTFTYNVLHCNDNERSFVLAPNSYPLATSKDFKDFAMQPQFSNTIVQQSTELMLADAYNYDVRPDASPGSGSPLLTGAVFNGIFNDPFFKNVAWRGALGTDNWLQGWVNFLPLQTKYN